MHQKQALIRAKNENGQVMLVSHSGRTVAENKSHQANTPVPVASVRCLTVFHDLEACQLSPDADIQNCVDAVMKSICKQQNPRSSLTDASQLPREWRAYKSYNSTCDPKKEYQSDISKTSTYLSIDQLEQCVDLGMSLLTVGRKPETVSLKLRDDLTHFVESHSQLRQHAVVLLVHDQTTVSHELRMLERSGVETFLITRIPLTAHEIASTPSSTCVQQCKTLSKTTVFCHVGVWDQIISETIIAGTSGKYASSHNVASGVIQAQNISHMESSMKTYVENDCECDSKGVSSDELEGTAKPKKWINENLKLNMTVTPMTPHNTRTVIEAKKRINENLKLNMKVTPMTPHNTRTVIEAELASRYLSISSCNTSSSTVAENVENSKTTCISSISPEHKQAGKNSKFNKENQIWSPRGVNHLDPYHIIFGNFEAIVKTTHASGESKLDENTPRSINTLTKANEKTEELECKTPPSHSINQHQTFWTSKVEGFKVTDRNVPFSVHHIPPHGLDFDYAWINRFLDSQLPELLVCCRLHQSGRISDIRLCGTVERVVRKSFGFIAHALYPANLYFRKSEIDNIPTGDTKSPHFSRVPKRMECFDQHLMSSSPCEHRGILDENQSNESKDCVAFRVGQKNNRVWALRVWKVPPNVAHIVAESMTTTTMVTVSDAHTTSRENIYIANLNKSDTGTPCHNITSHSWCKDQRKKIWTPRRSVPMPWTTHSPKVKKKDYEGNGTNNSLAKALDFRKISDIG